MIPLPIPAADETRAVFRRLSLSNRLEVVRAVRGGRAVRNPALAPIAVAYARLRSRRSGPLSRLTDWDIGPIGGAAVALIAVFFPAYHSTMTYWLLATLTVALLILYAHKRASRSADATRRAEADNLDLMRRVDADLESGRD